MRTLTTGNLKIYMSGESPDHICYILYPFEMPASMLEGAAKQFGISIVVINGMDWDNDLTPWPALGEPPGCPDFRGTAPEFLSLLITKVVPEVEKTLRVIKDVERTLLGVSLSGLFTLWQWMKVDAFRNIISLSGSFWYDGFVEWIKSRTVPEKSGRAYFLLGNMEAKTKVKAFKPVQSDTTEIVDFLKGKGLDVFFELVPGNHYQYAEKRLHRALSWMYGNGAG